MLEVGVYGNIFSRPWDKLKVVATKHTWYYNLWELCHRLEVEIEVEEKYHINPVRQGDRSIIDAAIEAGYRGDNLESVNVVRKSLHLIHMSDLVACDGETLDLSLVKGNLRSPLESKMQFPVEKPTKRDKASGGPSSAFCRPTTGFSTSPLESTL